MTPKSTRSACVSPSSEKLPHDINPSRSISPEHTWTPAANRAIDNSAPLMIFTVTIWRRPPIRTVRCAKLDLRMM